MPTPGNTVRALVRPGSDVATLPKVAVELVRGEMLAPSSLEPAMRGVSAVVSVAIGCCRRDEIDGPCTGDRRNIVLVGRKKKCDP